MNIVYSLQKNIRQSKKLWYQSKEKDLEVWNMYNNSMIFWQVFYNIGYSSIEDVFNYKWLSCVTKVESFLNKGHVFFYQLLFP